MTTVYLIESADGGHSVRERLGCHHDSSSESEDNELELPPIKKKKVVRSIRSSFYDELLDDFKYMCDIWEPIQVAVNRFWMYACSVEQESMPQNFGFGCMYHSPNSALVTDAVSFAATEDSSYEGLCRTMNRLLLSAQKDISRRYCFVTIHFVFSLKGDKEVLRYYSSQSLHHEVTRFQKRLLDQPAEQSNAQHKEGEQKGDATQKDSPATVVKHEKKKGLRLSFDL